METILSLDDDLIEQAQKLGRHNTKKEAVIAAIKEYIEHKEQKTISKYFGTIHFDDKYNYKKARNR
jgi:hypothetical protein